MTYVGASEPRSGCLFCDACEAGDDRARLVLHRGPRAYLILNAFPYTSGHLMAVPNRHVATVVDADADDLAETMALVQRAVRALTAEYHPDGFNIGINHGRAAGAGIQDHLHVHVVPRWNGDSNFMPVIGEVRVLPESLDATWSRLKAHLDE
jgi:ATP adenylyltransferase